MQKKLFRAAFISSPIIALVGNMPLSVIEKIQFPNIIYFWLVLTFFIFLFWVINIYIISKIKNPNSIKRYAFSFFIISIIQAFNLLFISSLQIDSLQDKGYFLPFIPIFGINSLILIISNSIIFQFQKQSADLEIEQLKVSNLEAQKQVLSQQLQPHFLFNALSTLKSLINENPSNAEDYTVRLSEFLRYSIKAKDGETVSLEEELKFSSDYVALQKVRFGDSFECKINLDNALMQRRIPAYAIQTLIENAIKHNAFNSKKPLIIEVEKVGNNVIVKNNILEKTKMEVSGLGLKNLNLRYKMIADMQIEINKDNTTFMVTIPLI